MKISKELWLPRNILESPGRRHVIKAGTRTAVIAAAVSRFGSLRFSSS